MSGFILGGKQRCVGLICNQFDALFFIHRRKGMSGGRGSCVSDIIRYCEALGDSLGSTTSVFILRGEHYCVVFDFGNLDTLTFVHRPK